VSCRLMSQLIGLLLGGLGAVLLWQGVKTYRASERRHSYEPINAEVLEATLDVQADVGAGADDPGSGTTYVPKITYEYTVDGETYTNDHLHPGTLRSGSDSKDEQQAKLNEYPEGETVEAYYDPSDPADSFLENESRTTQAIATLVIGAGVTLFGIVVFLGMV